MSKCWYRVLLVILTLALLTQCIVGNLKQRGSTIEMHVYDSTTDMERHLVFEDGILVFAGFVAK
jgi:hypothetical protein